MDARAFELLRTRVLDALDANAIGSLDLNGLEEVLLQAFGDLAPSRAEHRSAIWNAIIRLEGGGHTAEGKLIEFRGLSTEQLEHVRSDLREAFGG